MGVCVTARDQANMISGLKKINIDALYRSQKLIKNEKNKTKQATASSYTVLNP